MVFIVELVVVHDGANLELVDRRTTVAVDIAVAAMAAKSQLEQARVFYPINPPDGFVVTDDRTGQIIRSWESV
jgi:hypothetical protein